MLPLSITLILVGLVLWQISPEDDGPAVPPSEAKERARGAGAVEARVGGADCEATALALFQLARDVRGLAEDPTASERVRYLAGEVHAEALVLAQRAAVLTWGDEARLPQYGSPSRVVCDLDCRHVLGRAVRQFGGAGDQRAIEATRRLICAVEMLRQGVGPTGSSGSSAAG